MTMSRRFAIVPVFVLLLLQALPVMACVAMPGQTLASCCCEGDRHCPMRDQNSANCAAPDTCCVSETSSAGPFTISNAHPGEHSDLPATSPIADLSPDRVFQNVIAGVYSPRLSSYPTTPRNAVPLYLRHLRLTL
jgi:hypothetical protein